MALVTVQRSPTPSATSSPSVSESGSGEDDRRSQPRSISESFLTVKGAALFLPRGNSPTPSAAPRISQRRSKHTGDLQKHLQTMFTVLRPEDTIRLAVRLESSFPQVTRYMVVVSTNGRQDTEESIVLGMDFVSSDSCCTVGLVLPLWSDTLIHLDGDGGFSVSTVNRVHVFKPVSVQAMWSALQSLHKACEVARCHNYYPGSLFLTWVSYYQSRVSSNQFCVNEWNAMQDVESHRANSPVLFTDLPTERERTERLIKTRLREIMMQKDLENVTSKEIRTELEMQMVCNLREFKEFIDNEMIVILGQMDSPTEIFEHVYLGSEWNASNLEELQNSGVHYILNMTREIDNFFPGMFEYHNIRVYDEEATNLLEYWNDTYKFITKAKKAGAKCLVHCKMGVSRSASTVIAYAMKEYGWDLDTAFDYVKEKRAVTKPNPSFMKQLEEYQGILLASKQRHNKLWRSHSDSDLSDRQESVCKPSSHSLGRCNSHNNNTSSPSLHHFLGTAVLQALGAEPADSKSSDSHNGVCDSAGQEEVRSDCRDRLLVPLPRPRAATVVPEERLDNAASVVVTVPVALPHPPPSLHILPPTPELQRVHRGPPTHLSIPEERSSSEEISPLSPGSTDSDIIDQSLSDVTSDKHSPLSPANITTLPLVLPLTASDDNNNPSPLQIGGALDGRGEADGSSNHSADSIDFFSAREKFLGLSHDDRSRTLSEQAQQRTPLSLEENEETKEEEEPGHVTDQVSPQPEDSVDKLTPDRTPHDNGVSVRHIITEIEAICHPASCLPSPSPSSSSSSLPPPPHSPQLIQPEHQMDAETSEASHGSLTPPSHPQSPSMLPCDWPAGSVRRATEQLEQKLRQEMEMAACQRSPLHSPSAEQPPVRPVSTEHPPLHFPQDGTEQSITQGEITAVSDESKDGEKHTGSQTELHSSGSDDIPDPSSSLDSDISQVSGAMPIIVPTSIDSHMLTSSPASAGQLEESSPDTSAQEHQTQEHQTLQHQTLQHQTLQHQTQEHQTQEHQTLQHQTLQHQTLQHQTQEHQTQEHQTLQHQTLQHQTLQHQTLQHQTQEHQTQEHQTLQHQILQHQTLQHQTLQHQTLQHQTQEHQTQEHQTQEHQTQEHQTLQHQTLQHQTLQHQTLQHQVCSNQTILDGVTVQESDTDERSESSPRSRRGGCGPGCDAESRLARGSQALEKIQQTLRELQAFLHEGVNLETTDREQELGQPQGLRDVMDTEPGPCKEASSEPGLEVGQRLRQRQEGKTFLEPIVWHRAMELEARIRQAGLTTPSLMKRSASLAKLDCLELSANDLSDLDLRPHTRTTSSQSQDSFSVATSHPDDTWKKQKVLAQNTWVEKTLHGGRDLDESSSSAPCHCPKEDTRGREEPDGSGAVAPTRQQGRGHSSRRSRKGSAEKKQRAVTVLYNTM